MSVDMETALAEHERKSSIRGEDDASLLGQSTFGQSPARTPSWPAADDFGGDGAWLDNEIFDFDLPVSPQESTSTSTASSEMQQPDGDEDDDEVFIGAVGFKEKCVATNAELTLAERKSMSPPSAEQWVLISKDAMSIALELEQLSNKSGSKSSSASSAESSSTTHVDSSKSETKSAPKAGIKPRTFKEPSAASIPAPRNGESRIGAPKAVKASGLKPPSKKLGLMKPSVVVKPGHRNGAGPGARKIPTFGSNSGAPGRGGGGAGGGGDGHGGVAKRPTAPSQAPADKAPASKAGSRQFGLRKPLVVARPGQKNGGLAASGPGPSKLQPVRAMQKFGGANPTGAPGAGGAGRGGAAGAPGAGRGGAPKRPRTPSQVPANTAGKRRPSTPQRAAPSTPVFQEKKVVPKRILDSGSSAANRTPVRGVPTPRRSSIATIPRPSTPVQVRTPSARHTSISIPPSTVGTPSARRRSAIPTPNRRGSTVTKSTSTLSSTTKPRSSLSAQPAHSAVGRISPLFLSPLKTPPLFSLSPEAAEPETKPSNLTKPSDSSPEFSLSSSKTPVLANVLRSRTNVKETVRETTPVVKAKTPKDSPAVGMLIQFGSATPKNKKSVTKLQQQNQAPAKENLIDLD